MDKIEPKPIKRIDTREASRIIAGIGEAIIIGDKAAVIRGGQDLEDLGLPMEALRMEMRGISLSGDRLKNVIYFKTGEVELVSVNDSTDLALINKYKPRMTFEQITGAGLVSNPDMKTWNEFTPEEQAWATDRNNPWAFAMNEPQAPPQPQKPQVYSLRNTRLGISKRTIQGLS